MGKEFTFSKVVFGFGVGFGTGLHWIGLRVKRAEKRGNVT